MKIITHIDATSFIKLNFILVYRKAITIIMSIIGFVMLIVSFLYLIGKPLPGEFSVFNLMFGIISVVAIPLSVYTSAKKNYRNNSRLQEIIEYEFNNQSINISGPSFSSSQGWESVHKIIELRNWLLIYQTPVVFNPIPKASFGEHLQEFRNMLTEKNLLKR